MPAHVIKVLLHSQFRCALTRCSSLAKMPLPIIATPIDIACGVVVAFAHVLRPCGGVALISLPLHY
jgi:hypothetical protein